MASLLPHLDRLPPNPDRGLLAQVKPIKAELPRSFWKLLVFEAAAVILGAWAGRWLAAYFAGAVRLWPFLVAAGLFLIGSSLASAFSPVRMRRVISAVLQATAFLFGFLSLHPDPARITAVAAGFIFIFSFLGDEMLWRELEGRVRVAFASTIHRKIGRSLTGYLLAAITLSLPVWQAQALPVPAAQFRSFYDGSIEAAAALFPELKLDSTVQDFAESVIKRQMHESGAYDSLPGNVRDAEIRKGAAAIIQDSAKSLNLKVAPDMRLGDVFYAYLTRTLTGWKQAFHDDFSFTLIWAAAIFIFLRGLGVLMVWAATLVATLGYELMIALGYVSVVGEPAAREKIILT